MKSAYYSNSIKSFLEDSDDSILGVLSRENSSFVSSYGMQTKSWDRLISILKTEFQRLCREIPQASNWYIALEYRIPRREKRIDLVIIAEKMLFVVEFKLSDKKFKYEFVSQLEDYCLDLEAFHKESFNKLIVPVLFVSDAPSHSIETKISLYKDQIAPMVKVNEVTFCEGITATYKTLYDMRLESIDPIRWINSAYFPTPTIIEAAQHLFSNQDVEEITRTHSGAINLKITVDSILRIISNAKEESKKVVCFVTGVPGAGKTLVGLKVVHAEELYSEDRSLAAYFSGNGPLIKVLKEALTRDRQLKEKRMAQAKDEKPTTKKAIYGTVATFIQNLHVFIRNHYSIDRTDTNKFEAPPEHIAVFDEAQRCWSAEHFFSKHKTSKDLKVHKSEPEILLEIMDRHKDWAVMIALIGSGQEIHTGEAGIGEWGRVLRDRFFNWEVHITPELARGDASLKGKKLFENIPDNLKVFEDQNLHLAVSQRSYKAVQLANWVNLLIDNQSEQARKLMDKLNKYPIVMTRDLSKAKSLLKEHKRGYRRIGLLASSGAKRLRPEGVNVSERPKEVEWFLNGPSDVRSSYYLEAPVTEFGIQGLEIEWACLCWDADLRRKGNNWECYYFKGATWKHPNDNDATYILNKYRVLLTRAREGLIIWVPKGDEQDNTRLPEFYDPIAEYLKSCGIPEI